MNHERHPIDAHIGARIKRAREERKLTQEALAATLGVTRQAVTKYEAGIVRISVATLVAISRATELPLVFFYEGAESAG